MARRLRVREVKSMSLSFYHVHSRACDVRSIGFLDVKGCLNAVFRGMLGYGKSPCFSSFAVLKVFGVDWGVLILHVVDGVERP